jgi:hypothetical protein
MPDLLSGDCPITGPATSRRNAPRIARKASHSAFDGAAVLTHVQVMKSRQLAPYTFVISLNPKRRQLNEGRGDSAPISGRIEQWHARSQ